MLQGLLHWPFQIIKFNPPPDLWDDISWLDTSCLSLQWDCIVSAIGFKASLEVEKTLRIFFLYLDGALNF